MFLFVDLFLFLDQVDQIFLQLPCKFHHLRAVLSQDLISLVE